MTTLHEMPSTPTRRRTLRTLLLTVATLTLTGASADAAVTRLAIAADPDVMAIIAPALEGMENDL